MENYEKREKMKKRIYLCHRKGLNGFFAQFWSFCDILCFFERSTGDLEAFIYYLKSLFTSLKLVKIFEVNEQWFDIK